jgi:hypothetical protein
MRCVTAACTAIVVAEPACHTELGAAYAALRRLGWLGWSSFN